MSSFDDDLGPRLREVRREMFGEHGAPLMAGALGLPVRTWLNYESGVAMPGTAVLAFLELTGVEACWLRKGTGDKYREMAGGSRPGGGIAN